MAAILDDTVLDGALDIIKNNATKFFICKDSQPTTYTEASSTLAIGSKTGLTSGSYTGPANDTSGRKLTVNAITGGSVSASETAEFWALTGTSGTLYAAGPLSSNQVVTSGNTFSVTAFDIAIPDPV